MLVEGGDPISLNEQARQKLQWCWAAGTPTHHRWDLRHFDFMDLSQQLGGQGALFHGPDLSMKVVEYQDGRAGVSLCHLGWVLQPQQGSVDRDHMG